MHKLRFFLIRSKVHAYIFSYPKSGRTYLKKLISNANATEPLLVLKYKKMTIGNFINDIKEYRKEKKSPFLVFIEFIGRKKYFLFLHDLELYRYTEKQKRIILVRHPLDILVSNFYWSRRLITNKDVATKEIYQYISKDNFHELETLIEWMNKTVDHNNYFISFEETKLDPYKVIFNLFHSTKLPINEDKIQNSIELCNIDKLRNEEIALHIRSKKEYTENTLKFRKGKVLGYENNVFSKTELNNIRKIINNKLDKFYVRFNYF